MIANVDALNGLRRQRPEWAPWLAVVGEILREAASPAWDAMVPARVAAEAGPAAPLLAAVPAPIRAREIRNVFERLRRAARRTGPKMATLERVRIPDVDLATLFKASVCQNFDRVTDVALATGVDPEALEAIAALLPVPFLQACNRRWAASIPQDWTAGYCPICAAWPAFAEMRGIERSRYSRCGRCGAEWHAHALSCPFCATRDHRHLATLVPGNGASHAVVEACIACRGYVKTLTRLQGAPPATVMLDDLASVDLDIAALEQGYRRPNTSGCPLTSWAA